MKTDHLIAALAADATPERPLWPGLLAPLAPALALSALFLALTLGYRADLGQAMTDPLSAMRMVLTLTLGGLALWLGLRLSRPGAALRAPAAALMLVPLVAAGLWLWAAIAIPADGFGMAIRGKTMVYCLTFIPLLSLPPVAALFWTLRRAAPTAPALTGAVAGLAGSGFAAAVYALHCTEDSPLFYVTWYGAAIIAVTLAAGLLGQRLLRW